MRPLPRVEVPLNSICSSTWERPAPSHCPSSTLPARHQACALITGALGFFGSHLADRYSELGWYVCGIDNMTANVVSVTHPTVDSMMIGDARALTPKHVASVDLVVHAASPVGAAGILSAQGTIAGQIVAATQTVVDACVVAGVPLVNISTSEVYGITGVAWQGTSQPAVI